MFDILELVPVSFKFVLQISIVFLFLLSVFLDELSDLQLTVCLPLIYFRENRWEGVFEMLCENISFFLITVSPTNGEF